MVDRCQYEFDIEAWKEEHDRQCELSAYEEIVENGCWHCPHEVVEGYGECIFHLSPEERPEDQDASEAFVVAVEGDVPNQFIGAIFPEFDISGQELDAEERVDLRHAKVGNLGWNDATISVDITASGAVFGESSVQGVKKSDGIVNFNSVTFAGLDLKQANFGKPVSFRDTEFEGIAQFGEIRFEEAVTFCKAMFEDLVSFDRAEFGSQVDFNSATFLSKSTYDYAYFKSHAAFDSSEFTDSAFFRYVEFETKSSFRNIEFNSTADFNRTDFAPYTYFQGADFNGDTYFRWTDFKGVTNFREADFAGSVDLYMAEFQAEVLFSESEFREVTSFYRAQFFDDALFIRVSFDSESIFRRTKFESFANFKESNFDVEADFYGAEFRATADFSGVDFGANAYFSEADFEADADFSKVTFRREVVFGQAGMLPFAPFLGPADFSKATFHSAPEFRLTFSHKDTRFPKSHTPAFPTDVDFSNATFHDDLSLPELHVYGDLNFSNTNLQQANFRDANLSNANFEDADLTRAALYGTDLTNAKLYGARLTDARISDATDFGIRGRGRKLLTWPPRLFPSPEVIYDPRTGPTYDDDGDVNNYTRAATVYSELESLAQDNAASKLARTCFVWRKDMQRKRYLSTDGKRNDRELFLWIRSWLSNLVMRYGESPWRVVGVSLLTILGFTFLYSITGGVATNDPAPHVFAYTNLGSQPLGSNRIRIFFENLYFSTVTFSTLGYGDIQPATQTAKFLAGLQSLIGALLMALLVFVFGRRSTR